MKWDEKIWENEFDLWILHIKIRLHRNFHESLRKKISLTVWLFNFDYLPDEDRKKLIPKMKMKRKKFGRMNLIFEFSISKLGCMEIFMKVWGKKFWLIFKPFLTNRSKNEDEDEKIWENESDFWIFHIKIRLCRENLRKKFLTHF